MKINHYLFCWFTFFNCQFVFSQTVASDGPVGVKWETVADDMKKAIYAELNLWNKSLSEIFNTKAKHKKLNPLDYYCVLASVVPEFKLFVKPKTSQLIVITNTKPNTEKLSSDLLIKKDLVLKPGKGLAYNFSMVGFLLGLATFNVGINFMFPPDVLKWSFLSFASSASLGWGAYLTQLYLKRSKLHKRIKSNISTFGWYGAQVKYALQGSSVDQHFLLKTESGAPFHELYTDIVTKLNYTPLDLGIKRSSSSWKCMIKPGHYIFKESTENFGVTVDDYGPFVRYPALP